MQVLVYFLLPKSAVECKYIVKTRLNKTLPTRVYMVTAETRQPVGILSCES